MNKQIAIGLVLVLITSILLAGCKQATVSKTIDCSSTEVLCVGLVTSLGGISDQSYNQLAWEGMLKSQTEQVVDKVHYIETIDAKDYASNINTLADTGYDIIVTIGAQYSESTISAAQRYPDILFVGVELDQTEGLPNLVSLAFHPDQAGFQAGALAALLSRSKTIAIVLGPESEPGVKVLKEGFEAGVQYINPLIKIITINYPDSSGMALTDPRWAAGVAAQSIQEGADIVFDAGGLTGNGALVEAASHPGLYCIGVDGDLWENLPEARPCLVSSTVNNITQGVFDIIKLARDGAFPSGNFFGDSGLASYHDFDTLIPQAIKDEMDRITADLVSGSISSGTKSP